MKIYPVQHIAMLEPAHGNHKPPVYEEDTYRGQEEDEWDVQKVVDHQEIDNVTWYEIKWTGYDDTTWEPEENLKNAREKIQAYRRRISRAAMKTKGRKQMDQLKATDEPMEGQRTPPPAYEPFPPLQEWNPFFPPLQVHAHPVQPDETLWIAPSHEPSQDGEAERESLVERQVSRFFVTKTMKLSKGIRQVALKLFSHLYHARPYDRSDKEVADFKD